MEGEIISSEYIKPSSPTPQEHKIHNLSILDQILLPVFIPHVIYFPINPETTVPNISEFISQTAETLKKSLSKTLSHFYPFAGRIRDGISINCNDEGVLLVISKFPGSLSDFLKNPDPKACRAHIPGEPTFVEPGFETGGSDVVMIKVNYFDCGSIALGLIYFHKVADQVTFNTFLKTWARFTTHGDDDDDDCVKESYPDYTAQSLFPHKELQKESHLFTCLKKYFEIGKTVLKRYVFDSAAVSKLKAQMAESPKSGPSRVEAVSTFLWKCFMVAAAASKTGRPGPNDGHDSLSLVTHIMNIRRKAESPFPGNSFGNFIWLVPASTVNDEAHRDMKHLFGNLRTSISKVNADLVKKMQGDEGFSGYLKNLEDCWSQLPKKADYLSITSWCSSGLYNLDFGWGKPIWITACDAGCDTESPFLNKVWLMDTRQGDGVEAWLVMEESCFAEFDKIQEVYDLALVDPSPLDFNKTDISTKII